MADALQRYRSRRDFAATPEPKGGGKSAQGRAFVIQKHWASRLHYDLRLELDGVMKSWAVPKGPSFDPHDKRMAVQVEDHPVSYNDFEGTIPPGQYGAGKVIIWDEGTWEPEGDARRGYRQGKLKFALHGAKLQGHWTLVRMKGRESEKQPPWLLIKERDEHARPAEEFSVVDEMPDSVVPLRKKRARRGSRRRDGEAAPAAEAPRVPGVAARLPATLKPQLATLVEGIPADPAGWLFEMKLDGYRLLARVQRRSVKLYTRNGNDWTDRLPHLARAVRELGLPSGWLDGEIVVLSDHGVPSFQALQNAFEASRTGSILYYLFDAPFLAGRDLRAEPLTVRRALLEQALGETPPAPLRLSEAFDVAPRDLVASACRMGLEGVIGKRRDAPYVSRRSESWIKLKCSQRQEFVVVGYTAPKGRRQGLGALLLAVHDEQGALRYAGKVGSGFDESMLADLAQRLGKLHAPRADLAGAVPRERIQWVEPRLVVEVSFGEWTRSGHIRHAVFRGVRRDKPARRITREQAIRAGEVDAAAGEAARPAPRKSGAAADKAAGSLRVTHPERVVDRSTGTTKLDVVRYYALVAPLLLAHLQGRPTSLVRAPAGIDGQLFFQKHLEGAMPGVRKLDRKLDPGHPPLIEVPTPAAVLAAAQANVLEFHTWNATKTAIDRPDRMTFDLDPGKGVGWKAVQQATLLVRALLEELGLASFAKTSGGKGMHVVVPLRRHYDWDAVKGYSQAITQHLARTLPKVFVAKSGPRNRVGRIFVDYLRNGFGATTVAAWSLRARPGLGVSVPVRWDEVPKLESAAQWTLANIHTRLDEGNAPWDDYRPQALGAAMKRLGYRPGE
ncbi:DNA ligase D [Bordetella sp. 2513F-2]